MVKEGGGVKVFFYSIYILKDIEMLDEASLESARHPSVRHLSHHPSTESLTLQLSARVGVVGG